MVISHKYNKVWEETVISEDNSYTFVLEVRGNSTKSSGEWSIGRNHNGHLSVLCMQVIVGTARSRTNVT
jgi:hypothetical protein